MTSAQLDHRIDVLLRLREAAGEWVEVSQHKPGSSGARYAAMKWKRHCRETKWEAFQWETHGSTLYGRFVGTRMVATGKVKGGASWTGNMMRRPA
jgi:hypothetical protein